MSQESDRIPPWDALPKGFRDDQDFVQPLSRELLSQNKSGPNDLKYPYGKLGHVFVRDENGNVFDPSSRPIVWARCLSWSDNPFENFERHARQYAFAPFEMCLNQCTPVVPLCTGSAPPYDWKNLTVFGR